jgi:hypothetical protein
MAGAGERIASSAALLGAWLPAAPRIRMCLPAWTAGRQGVNREKRGWSGGGEARACLQRDLGGLWGSSGHICV